MREGTDSLSRSEVDVWERGGSEGMKVGWGRRLKGGSGVEGWNDGIPVSSLKPPATSESSVRCSVVVGRTSDRPSGHRRLDRPVHSLLSVDTPQCRHQELLHLAWPAWALDGTMGPTFHCHISSSVSPLSFGGPFTPTFPLHRTFPAVPTELRTGRRTTGVGSV